MRYFASQKTIGGSKTLIPRKTVTTTKTTMSRKTTSAVAGKAPRKSSNAKLLQREAADDQPERHIAGLDEMPALYPDLATGLDASREVSTRLNLEDGSIDDDLSELTDNVDRHIEDIYSAISTLPENGVESGTKEFETFLSRLKYDIDEGQDKTEAVQSAILKLCYEILDNIWELHYDGLQLKKFQYRHLEEAAAFDSDRQLTLLDRIDSVKRILKESKSISLELLLGGDASVMLFIYLPYSCDELGVLPPASVQVPRAKHAASQTAVDVASEPGNEAKNDSEAQTEDEADAQPVYQRPSRKQAKRPTRKLAKRQWKPLKHTNDMKRSQYLMDTVFHLNKFEREKGFSEMWKKQMAAGGISVRAGTSGWVEALRNNYSERLPHKKPHLWATILANPQDSNRDELVERITTTHLDLILRDAMDEDGEVDTERIVVE